MPENEISKHEINTNFMIYQEFIHLHFVNKTKHINTQFSY